MSNELKDKESNESKLSRLDFFKTVAGTGGAVAAVGAISASVQPKEVYAALLDTNISEDSVLSKMKKTGKLKVGFSQTKPNFYRDAKTNKLRGIFYDATEFLGKQCEVEIDYQEVSWGNATVGLRKGDFDLFVSSLTYTVPRALVINYAGPIHHKGAVGVVHKDNAHRFKTHADLNSEDVTFVVTLGDASANQIKTNFPKAKIMEVSGQLTLVVETVSRKQATAFIGGDFDIEVIAGQNPWMHPVWPAFDLLPNTWACRYGDPEWKYFLDMFCNRMLSTGDMKKFFAKYREELIDSK